MINLDFTKIDFVEYYDSDKDPWQMDNLHKTAGARLEFRLGFALYHCSRRASTRLARALHGTEH